MGLKENFNQALKELLNRGGLVGSDLEEKSKTQSDLDSYLDMPLPSFEEAKGEPAGNEPSAGINRAPVTGERFTGERFSNERLASEKFASERLAGERPVRDTAFPPNFEDHTARGPERYTSPQPGIGGYNRMFQQVDEMTVISKSTMIVGDVRSLANVTIDGNVRGKVDVLKDATIRGMLIGDLTCNNSDMQGSSIQGNVFSKGSTYIDNDSILLGDLKAQYASIDGKVKGNMEIGSKIELHENSIVAGNIITNTITIADGANVKGFINTTFLSEHGDTAFPKQVIMENPEA
jgi:cytoskeletal protein CcmA (bactofilin family)